MRFSFFCAFNLARNSALFLALASITYIYEPKKKKSEILHETCSFHTQKKMKLALIHNDTCNQSWRSTFDAVLINNKRTTLVRQIGILSINQSISKRYWKMSGFNWQRARVRFRVRNRTDANGFSVILTKIAIFIRFNPKLELPGWNFFSKICFYQFFYGSFVSSWVFLKRVWVICLHISLGH